MIDPLSFQINTKGVDTTLPLLPEADYVLQISDSSIDANKLQTGGNWNITASTTSEIQALDGRPVKPNFPLYAMPCALQAKEGTKDPEGFKRGICSNIDAIFQTDMETRPDFDNELVKAAVGKLVIGHVTITTHEGKQRNQITSMKPYLG